AFTSTRRTGSSSNHARAPRPRPLSRRKPLSRPDSWVAPQIHPATGGSTSRHPPYGRAGWMSLSTSAARWVGRPPVQTGAVSDLPDPQLLGHGEGDVLRPAVQLGLPLCAPGAQLLDHAAHQHLRSGGTRRNTHPLGAFEPLGAQVL